MTADSPRAGGPARRLDMLLVFGLALFAQRFVLGLSFQLDDYNLLADPAGLFAALRNPPGEPADSHMLRFPVWVAWSLVRAPFSAPLAAWPFHLLGLVLHAVTAALLARLIFRYGPPDLARWAGFVAGIGYGCGAGSAAALGWISGQPDVFANLFGLAGLGALLAARERRMTRPMMTGLLLIGLALLSKGPALLIPLVTGLALVAHPKRKRLVREAFGLGFVTAASLVVRRVYLGGYLPTYPGASSPEPAWIPRGLLRLGQALVPWNRSPEAAGFAPWLDPLAETAHGRLAALIALAIFGSVALGLLLLPSRRRLVLPLAALALVLAVIPGGPIDPGPHRAQSPTDNATARAMLLALLVTWSIVGFGSAALWYRQRFFGTLALVLLALPTFGLRYQVIGIEKRASSIRDNERARVLSRLELGPDTAQLPAPEPSLLLLEPPPSDFAGVAQLGGLIGKSFQAPFVRRDDLKIEQDSDLDRLLARSLAPELRAFDGLFVPHDGKPRVLPGARRDAGEPLVDIDNRVPRIAFGEIAQPRKLAGFLLDPPPSSPIQIVLEGGNPRQFSLAFEFDSAGRVDPQPVVLGTPRTLEYLLCSPWQGVRLEPSEGYTPERFEALFELPRLELEAIEQQPGAGGLTFAVSETPRVLVRWPTNVEPPNFLRFELTVELFHTKLRGLCDVPVLGDSQVQKTHQLECELAAWHTQTDLPPGESAIHGVPWALFSPAFQAHGLDRRRSQLVVFGLPKLGPPGATSAPVHVEFRP